MSLKNQHAWYIVYQKDDEQVKVKFENKQDMRRAKTLEGSSWTIVGYCLRDHDPEMLADGEYWLLPSVPFSQIERTGYYPKEPAGDEPETEITSMRLTLTLA